MFKVFSKSLCCVAMTLVASTALAETSVWKATKDGETVYLGGTVHLLRPSDYPLPQPYETAYQDSDVLYFETDIRGMSDFSTQARIMMELMYQDDRTLSSVLSRDVYELLTNYADSVGLPLHMMDKFKPGLLMTTLQLIEFQQLGYTPEGVDAYFDSRAIDDGKKVGKFETIDEQIGFLSRMGEGNESEFIELSLEDLKEIELSMEQMIESWRKGDAESLAAVFVDDMKEGYPAVYKELLLDRNNNWLPQLEALFNNQETEFVLVGAAHLVGDDGLLAQLGKKGYAVSQLP
jgi:uncharacterized protein YbaP (TraB family)